ncbi:Uncharacterised protein [Escherichia coli]|nr:Uncharacterised protein [Escherichia coli]
MNIRSLDIVFGWLEEILRQLFEERCCISASKHPHRTRRFNALNNVAIYSLEFATNDGCPYIKGLVNRQSDVKGVGRKSTPDHDAETQHILFMGQVFFQGAEL